MGSDAHYCLRWNNHQSNLLGVFSQLLQDESLVDVTLACSEGQSIRAHKVSEMIFNFCIFIDEPDFFRIKMCSFSINLFGMKTRNRLKSKDAVRMQ